MADLKSLADSRGTLLNFDPRRLKSKPGLNSRDLEAPDNKEHVEALAQSIAAVGWKAGSVLTIFAEGDDVYVEDGNCRLAAVMLAISRGVEIIAIPCIPNTRGVNDVERVLAQTIHNSGKRLTPLEQGVAFKRALALGASVQDIAAKVGKSATYVSQMIDFQAAPQEVHNLVREGVVSATTAAQVVRREGAQGVAKLARAADEAKIAGKAKVTASDIAEDDALWSAFRKAIAARRERPSRIADSNIRQVAWELGIRLDAYERQAP